MPFKMKEGLDGLEGLIANLRELKNAIANRILRKALTQAGKILVRQVKALASTAYGKRTGRMKQFSGQLRKSIGQKIKVWRERGKASLMVGPRRKFNIDTGLVRIRGKKKGEPIRIRPTNYAHLVEFGTSHSAAKPFIGPALKAAKVPCRDAIANAIANGVKRAKK